MFMACVAQHVTIWLGIPIVHTVSKYNSDPYKIMTYFMQIILDTGNDYWKTTMEIYIHTISIDEFLIISLNNIQFE